MLFKSYWGFISFKANTVTSKDNAAKKKNILVLLPLLIECRFWILIFTFNLIFVYGVNCIRLTLNQNFRETEYTVKMVVCELPYKSKDFKLFKFCCFLCSLSKTSLSIYTFKLASLHWKLYSGVLLLPVPQETEDWQKGQQILACATVDRNAF